MKSIRRKTNSAEIFVIGAIIVIIVVAFTLQKSLYSSIASEALATGLKKKGPLVIMTPEEYKKLTDEISNLKKKLEKAEKNNHE